MPARTLQPNPIRLVRQGAKRRATPSVLTPFEIKVLINNLSLRERTLVLVVASTGLRQSELFGLKWGDINFAQGTMSVTRSIVCGVVGPCKTESSQKPVPVHPTVLESLAKWKDASRYIGADDWIFASNRHRGRRPIWGQAILRKYIRPVAHQVGTDGAQQRFWRTEETLSDSDWTEESAAVCHWQATTEFSKRGLCRSSLPRYLSI